MNMSIILVGRGKTSICFFSGSSFKAVFIVHALNMEHAKKLLGTASYSEVAAGLPLRNRSQTDLHVKCEVPGKSQRSRSKGFSSFVTAKFICI